MLSTLLCLLALAPAAPPGVYALEFHVDYWNSLGWRDPYSAAAHSDRQRAYAGAEQVYTPQMIVNGTNAFVGSNRKRADAAIAAGLASRPRVTLSAHVDGERLSYRASKASAGARLCVAIVDAHRTTKVPRGENAGKTLEHARVVRAFSTSKLVGETGSVTLPGEVPAGGSVVAFVQEESGAILGAAEAR